jgi:hypothetical protein
MNYHHNLLTSGFHGGQLLMLIQFLCDVGIVANIWFIHVAFILVVEVRIISLHGFPLE